MSGSIFIDGVEYVRASKLLEALPVIGCRDYVEELQRFDLYMTTQAFDYIYNLPNSTFKASNGYEITCHHTSSSLTETALQLHSNTFRGLRQELYAFFSVKKYQTLTKEIAAKIKEAMKEISTKVVARSSEEGKVLWLNLEKY